MLFNSLTFVAFFVLLSAVYFLTPTWRAKKGVLLAGSYLFYAAWNPPFVILLWFSTLVDWYVAKALAVASGPARRKGLLLISLVVNLGLLGFFKYGAFLVENFDRLLALAGIAYQPAAWSIVLPVGISFYTFQTLSYTLDVYRGSLKPGRSFLDFALYVTFFPQLVAGPIVRAGDFLPQCEQPPPVTLRRIGWGMFLITLGLFQKTVMADTLLAGAADSAFGWRQGPLATLDAWAGLLAFSGQIFCDFSGYSTCAIGTALCLGFILPDNFRFPYAAIGFSDFWRRWHITLSTWLRDYLYIPLGGRRFGALITMRNLLLTMFLGGLWHGASWTFVAWGVLHGIYLVIEHTLKRVVGSPVWLRTGPARFVLAVLTFVFVSIAWVFFRAPDFAFAGQTISSLLGLSAGGAAVLSTLSLAKVGVAMAGLLAAHGLLRETSLEVAMLRMPPVLTVGLWVAMAFAVILTQGGGHAFIYFQF
jgi:alginate O-acetyltransferase complex protein AlgI